MKAEHPEITLLTVKEYKAQSSPIHYYSCKGKRKRRRKKRTLIF